MSKDDKGTPKGHANKETGNDWVNHFVKRIRNPRLLKLVRETLAWDYRKHVLCRNSPRIFIMKAMQQWIVDKFILVYDKIRLLDYFIPTIKRTTANNICVLSSDLVDWLTWITLCLNMIKNPSIWMFSLLSYRCEDQWRYLGAGGRLWQMPSTLINLRKFAILCQMIIK